jgi:hypothetical protein
VDGAYSAIGIGAYVLFAPRHAWGTRAGHPGTRWPSELTMTQRYMHLSPAAFDSAIRLLDGRGNIVATAAISEGKING